MGAEPLHGGSRPSLRTTTQGKVYKWMIRPLFEVNAILTFLAVRASFALLTFYLGQVPTRSRIRLCVVKYMSSQLCEAGVQSYSQSCTFFVQLIAQSNHKLEVIGSSPFCVIKRSGIYRHADMPRATVFGRTDRKLHYLRMCQPLVLAQIILGCGGYVRGKWGTAAQREFAV